MPGLYGFTANSNVSVNVGNTTGLYQQNTGNVYVVNNAQTLLNTLSQAGNVNFALTDGNSKVLAYTANIGTPAGTYGSALTVPVLSVTSDGRVTGIVNVAINGGSFYSNANVASYLPTYTGSLANSSSVVALVANAATQASSIDNLNSEYTSLNATVIAQGIQIGQKANISGQAFTGNISAPYFIGNVTLGASGVTPGTYGSDTTIPTIVVDLSGRITQITTNAISGGGSYGNSNVAAFLPTYNGTIKAGTIFNGSGLAIQGPDYAQLQWTNGAAVPASEYDVGTGSWFYLDAGGGVFQSNSTGNLKTITFGNDASITAGGNVTAPYFLGDGSKLTGLPATYGNANVAAYLPTYGGTILVDRINFTNNSGIIEQGQDRITITGNVDAVNTGAYFNDTGEAAIFAYTDVTITSNVQGSINPTWNFDRYGNLTAPGNITTTTGNVQAAYFKGDGSKLTNLPVQAGTYSNANVASYMPVFGGNILAGNVNIPYTSGTRNRGPLAVGGNISQYDSGVIASFIGNEPTYLYTSLQNSNSGATAYSSYALNDDTHTYYGELGINSSTYDYAAAGYPNNAFSKPYATFLQSTGANLAIGTYGNYGVNFIVNGGTVAADAMTIANTGNVTVTGNLAVGSQATVGNIKSTSGYFWANGASYASTTTATGTAGGSLTGSYPNPTLVAQSGIAAGVFGNTVTIPQITIAANGIVTSASNVSIVFPSGGTSFNGNLTGNALSDTTNLRVLINASAYSAPTTTTSGTTSTFLTTTPVYTAGVLQTPAVNTTVGAVVSSNIAYQSGYQTATNRTYTNLASYAQVWPQTANTMVGQDRVRATNNQLDVQLNGKTWGTMSSASVGTLALVAQSGQTSVLGSGQAASAVGAIGSISIVPTGGSANVQYATGVYAAINQTAGGTGATASNIGYARLFSGAVAGQSGNIIVANAVALYTFNGWVSSNVSLVTNAYVILNEDTRSVISTVGNISATGALSAFGNTRVNGYQSPNKNFYDTSITANIVVSSGTAKSMPFQQIALNANATIYTSSLGFDTVYDFSIQQDGTGNRTLTWYNNGSTYAPTGVLNPAPNSVTYARAIMSDTGFWTVSYSNASVPVLTVTQTNAFVGTAGQMVAVSNGTAKNNGQLAYWDVTNTRWSWVDTNLAVT